MNIGSGDACNNKGRITVAHTGGTGTKTYVWKGTSQTTKSARNLGAGTYNVTVTDTKGCSAVSSDVDLCQLNKSIGESFEVARITLYPNPSNGSVLLSFEAGFEGERIEVSDLQGRVVATETLHGQSQNIDLSHLVDGTYILKVNFGNYIWNSRVIISH